ncbi:alpha-1,3-glucanase [Colletotrichum orchidophilum]|uniref:Alpha-1,3-glucanase n=1 Tax=Colletotrichum orchidophilum TaxID=1209926 RepID=A0A1G4AN54_9PEZI|nr:alpha-1,3-glucanase [Colletotrichum orchidophilum]OHE90610.1 alpha-1,3-glucanase [Colletotrichum orchidophilum]
MAALLDNLSERKFALNIRQDNPSLGTFLGRAIEAADALGFKIIFSYDYTGGGPWGANRVIQLTKNYCAFSSYYHDEKGRPLVLTFEGPGNAKDWEYIIQKTN